MEIFGIQIIGIFFGLLIAYFSFLNYKRKEFTLKEFVVWIFIGFVFVLFSGVPSLVYPLSNIISLQRPLDMFIIFGFMFLIGALLYTYSVVRKTQKKLEQLVMKLAIDKKDDKRMK